MTSFAIEELRSFEGYDAHFFSRLAAVESGHFWFRSRNRLIIDTLRRHAPRARSILEAGCGTGFVLQAMRKEYPSARLVATELLFEAFPFARERVPDAEFYQATTTALPFREEFDVVAALDVIEHIEDDKAAMRELAGAARPGGLVVVTVPQHRKLWSAVDVVSGHKRRYSRGELVRLAREAGLQVELVTSFMTVLLPLIALARLTKRDPAAIDEVAELKIGPVASSILESAARIDEALIGKGARLPVGGSLLLAARVL